MIERRDAGPTWLATIAGVVIAAALCAAALRATPVQPPRATRPPNIVFILADDLGSGELGAYGQTKIRTPRLDRMAAEGMRFTRFYSGSPVCAPSRATFLTGRHTGHAYVRDNHELGGFPDEEERGQLPLPATEPTVAEWLKSRGYATALVGKWGLGGPGSVGVPTRHGFDRFFGYLDQKQAHSYYPTHLWRNEARFPLANAYFSPHQTFTGDPADPAAYARYRGTDYAIDLMTREALGFIRDNASRPFFLYFAPTLPHLALQAPESAVRAYEGAFPETPYLGDKQYLPNRTPRATYAAMVSYLDAQVGQLLDTLKSAGLDDNTLVIFTSDNVATFDAGGAPTAFFNSHGGLRGTKTDVYEGGIRVPFIAHWPGKVRAGATSDHLGANWDMWATFADLVGGAAPSTDGVSIVPTLVGRGRQRAHAALYWEFHSKGSAQAVRMGRWKGVRSNVKRNPAAPIELYDLSTDPGESSDIATAHPDIVSRIEQVMRARTRSGIDEWNF
jgi:arylsulfatase A-like enzyme